MKFLGITALTLLMAAPAAAQVDQPFTLNDGCGDADQSLVRVEGQEVVFPTDRGPWHDIGHASLTPRQDGSLDVKLQVCGTVPAPEPIRNSWTVNVDVGNDCDVSFRAYDVYGYAPRAAEISKSCVITESAPLGYTTSYGEVAQVDLPASAWNLSGAVFSFHLTKNLLTAAQVGRVLKDPETYTTDGATAGVYVGDAHVRGPGADDYAKTLGTITLD